MKNNHILLQLIRDTFFSSNAMYHRDKKRTTCARNHTHKIIKQEVSK